MRPLRLVVAAVLVLFGFALVPARAGTPEIETFLLQQVNQGRATVGKPPLVRHAGLSTKAREHSQNMSVLGNLTHDGAQGRFDTAAPDPTEANGAPDDGFTGAWCENVAFRSTGESDQQAASNLWTQWLNSPPHRSCMNDESSTGYNAVGIGLFNDGSRLWATMMPVVDNSPPSRTTTPPPGTSASPPTTSQPPAGSPEWSPASVCGSTVQAPVFGALSVVTVVATDPQGTQVSVSATGAPGFATLTTQASGGATTAIVSLRPSLLDWLFGLLGPGPTVTLVATDAAGQASSCSFRVTVALL